MLRLHDVAAEGPLPGMIGRCASLMARFYADKLGFGLDYEADTLRSFARFVTGFDPKRDGLWLACRDDEIVGSIAVDGRASEQPVPGGARLRWLYVAASARRRGVGQRMVALAGAHARRRGYPLLALVAHVDLQGAARLYEAAGFRRGAPIVAAHWGTPVELQTFTLALDASVGALHSTTA